MEEMKGFEACKCWIFNESLSYKEKNEGDKTIKEYFDKLLI